MKNKPTASDTTSLQFSHISEHFITKNICEKVNNISEYETLFSELRKKLTDEKRIISGFPGIGKSVFFMKNPETTSDSDSSQFSWLLDKNGEKIFDENGKPLRNPNFLHDYIKHLISCLENGKNYLLISSHKEVRDALLVQNIPFSIVYPDKNLKNEYLERYRNRWNDENFLQLMENNFENFIDEIEQIPENSSCQKIKISSGQFLSEI